MVLMLPVGVVPQVDANHQPSMGPLLVPPGAQLAPAGNVGCSLGEVEMVPENQGVGVVFAQ